MLIAVPVGIVASGAGEHGGRPRADGRGFVAYSMPTFLALHVAHPLVFRVAEDLPSRVPKAPPSAPPCTTRARWFCRLEFDRGLVAMFSRFVRSSATTALTQDYIRTRSGKGISPYRLIRKHLLRNTLGPMVTLFGVSLPFVIGGAIVVEEVFNYPGWTGALEGR